MRLAPITLLAAALATGLQAQEGLRWIGLQGARISQRSRESRGTEALGLAAGGWCTNRYGLEVAALSTNLDSTRGGRGRETQVVLSGLLALRPDPSWWRPYLRAGLGEARVPPPWSSQGSVTTRPMLLGGIGLQASLGPGGLLTLEARGARIETRVARSEFQMLAGLGFRWGGRPALHRAAVEAEKPPTSEVPDPPPQEAPGEDPPEGPVAGTAGSEERVPEAASAPADPPPEEVSPPEEDPEEADDPLRTACIPPDGA